MSITPIVSNNRSNAFNVFEYQITQARINRFVSKLLGRSSGPSDQVNIKTNLPNKTQYLGVVDLLIEKIQRNNCKTNSYDREFRPLDESLRYRWIETYLSSQKNGILPITIYQRGNAYFVVDGHLRISVAKSLGAKYILAEIWYYPQTITQPHSFNKALAEIKQECC
jgi:hypothetical protein